MPIEFETLNRLADAAASFAIAMLWQSALLAAVVAILAMALRQSSPALRYWLWQIVAIKLLLMPFWTGTLNVEWPTAMTAAIATAPEPALPAEPKAPVAIEAPATQTTAGTSNSPTSASAIANTTSTSALTWAAWLLVAWVIVVGWQCVHLIIQRRRLAKLLGTAMPANGELEPLVRQCSEALALQRPVAVLLTMEDCSPFVFGARRPRLVLPQSLPATLSKTQLRQVVLHELAHVHRLDLVWCWIPQLARIVFFFNPVAHLAQHRTRLESELACDQLAMQSERAAPSDYVQTLLAVMSHLSASAHLRRSTLS